MSSDIQSWLEDIGLGQYAAVFAENDIDLEILGELTEDDFRELGMTLGHRKRVMKALGGGLAETPAGAPADGPVLDAASSAERRQLTVMFCDLVDSTGLSIRVDPEDLRLIISSFQKCCERVINVFGGSVARYMGDGMLVYFGYPAADEQDPERAVRAGLEIIRAVGQLKIPAGVTLQARVGIATGEVVVGDLIGKGISQEHAVVGETPNLAARLQGLAKPDAVVVSHTTRRLVGELFEYLDLGSHPLKGFESPVRAFRAVRERNVVSRFEAAHAGGEDAPILGREAEVEHLLDRWNHVRGGQGQLVLVLGEAGIGKSRLSLAFRHLIQNEPHNVVRYFCVSYHKKTALFPVAAQIEYAAGISRDDKPAVKLRKIEVLVAQFSSDGHQVVPLYASLLGVPLGESYPPLNLTPRLQKERTLAALEEQLVAQAGDVPCLAIFEDMHWVDPTTLDFLEALIRRLHDLPMLVILTGRPEFLPPWPKQSNTSTLHLEKLGERFVRGMIETVTGGKPLPASVVRKIQEKTDGVPLFVEELTKTLLESGMLKENKDRYVLKDSLPDLAIPDTLQDSLMARLDRLGAGKKTAQIGAAVGRVFGFELMMRISPYGRQELEASLERLAAAGLVFRHGVPPRAEYIFKHALVQDAAYSSLLKEQRRQLHKKIAESLELYFPETGQHHPETLAHHYTRAGEIATAIPHWERAARMATERASHEEALRHVNLALDLISQLPDDVARMQLELGLQLTLGLVLESTRGYAAEEVEEAYDRARQICEHLEKTAELVPVLLGLYVFNFVRGNFSIARTFVERCVELSKTSRKLDYLIESYAALGFIQCHMGNLSAARVALEDCIALYQSRPSDSPFENITAQDPCAASMALLGIVLWLQGEDKAGDQMIKDALTLADDLGRPINHAVVLAHAAEYRTIRNEYREAIAQAQQGMQVAGEFGHDPWYLCCLMHAGIATGLISPGEEGLNMAQKGIAMWDAAGARVNASYFIGATARDLHLAGQTHEALQMLEQAFEVSAATEEKMYGSLLWCWKGDMLAGAGQHHDKGAARDCYRAGADLAIEQGAISLALRALLGLHSVQAGEPGVGETTAAISEVLSRFPPDAGGAEVATARALLKSTSALPADH